MRPLSCVSDKASQKQYFYQEKGKKESLCMVDVILYAEMYFAELFPCYMRDV